MITTTRAPRIIPRCPEDLEWEAFAYLREPVERDVERNLLSTDDILGDILYAADLEAAGDPYRAAEQLQSVARRIREARREAMEGRS